MHAGGTAAGLSSTIQLPLRTFAQSWNGSHGGKGVMIYFPMLELFNESGDLIFAGHDPGQNSKILKGLPGTLHALKPIGGGDSLVRVMQKFPQIPNRDALLSDRRPTVLSVFLQDCHACSLQESALDQGTEGEIRKNGMNLVVINVERPGEIAQPDATKQ